MPRAADLRPAPAVVSDAGTPGPDGAAPAAAGRGRVGSAWRKRATVVAFLAPALALYAVFVMVPIVQGAYYSGFDWNGLEPLEEFVGLQNYRDALADPVFLASLRHVFVILALSLTLQLPFALGLAVLLNQRMRGRALFRLLFFLPFVLSEVITGIVFRLLLQPGGLVDGTLDVARLGGLTQQWLADPHVVRYTVFVVVSWKYFGLHMILYLAGLQQIPPELEEAAALDGASRAQTFRYVTLPLLGPTIRISVFLSIIGSLQVFDMVWVMTGGGPVNASNTMATYMVDRGFERSRFGYGSAVAVLVFLISFVIALGYQRIVLRRDADGALTTMGA
ncbi:MAG TPA: sugar ABC transporter permease [Acidimicrobiales bacterium]|nr:sugar ABC transporter permease [Acidimicrobiales bacterium]